VKLSAQDIFALTVALALHAVLGALLLFGAPKFFEQEKKHIIPVHAVYLDKGRDVLAAQKAAKEKTAQEARRKAAEQAARLKTEQEAQRKDKADAQRKLELETKRQAEVEAKRVADELGRKNAEALAKKKAADEQARKRVEAEKQHKLAEEKAHRLALEKKQRQEDTERMLKDALAAESQALEAQGKADAQARQDQSDSALYQQQLFHHVQKHWVRPAGVDDDFSCKIRIHQLPGGQIQSYELLESCGNAFLDASVENAIRKSDPLPLPKNSRVFDRTLTLTFKP
jgi:colicin import membrane protein